MDIGKHDKPFMTYDQQVHKLKVEKKLEITDEAYALKLLKEHSYFALISGYKRPFKTADGTYKPHTSIEDIYRLYVFDDKLRALFLQYILKIEKHIKSLISYSFCDVYGEAQLHYLNANNYNYIPQNQGEVHELITRLTSITSNPKNYPYIRHQQEVHGNIPLWVMMKALTLGTVSKMYSLLPQKIQHLVSREFDYVHEGMLMQLLNILARVRNVCAHNERLYDYRYNKGSIDNTYIHSSLRISMKKGHYQKGKNDLFAIVIVLKYLLTEDAFSDFMDELDANITTLLSKINILQQTQLYKYMGFPENWKDIRSSKKAE